MSVFENKKKDVENILSRSTQKYEKSSRWREYFLGPTFFHCESCLAKDGKIYSLDEEPLLPAHENCLCYMDWLRKVSCGHATDLGINGADFWLKQFGKLPNYYIPIESALNLGWIPKMGNLNEVAPGKMIGGDIFGNKKDKLPSAPGRIWYECDVDYKSGYRNNYRIVYSNDGLMFRTNDHYKTFIEIE